MVNTALPFAHINLCFNPFGELDKTDRSYLAVVNLDNLPILLNKSGQAIQFVADHGRGKSTHLIALHQQFAQAPYVQLHAGSRPSFTASDLCFIDSIENLSFFKRLKVYRKMGSLALTTHRNLSLELSLAGYQVTTISVALTDTHTLQQVFNRRIEHARRNAGPVPVLDLHHIQKLQKRFSDDIRSMEHYLYNIFQSLTDIHHVKV